MKTIPTSDRQQGFTLIELMIVVAILGILAAVAMPAYQTYVNESRFSEVILATAPFKTAFEINVQSGRITSLADADSASNGIPAAVGASGKVASVDVVNGVITAVSTTTDFGGVAYSYVMTPTITIPIQWTVSGSCLSAGVC